MMRRIIGAGVFLLMVGARIGLAQVVKPAPPPDSVGKASARLLAIMRMQSEMMQPLQAARVNGSVDRAAIPNEYFDVTVTRGVVHIDGGTSDRLLGTL